MDREDHANGGAWFSYPTSFKSLLHWSNTKPTLNTKSKAGIQRHIWPSHPATRTPAKPSLVNFDARKNINREKAHSRRFSLVIAQQVGHRHSIPQSPTSTTIIIPVEDIGQYKTPPKNNRQDGKSYATKYNLSPYLQASTTEQNKAHTHQNASRNLLPQRVLLL